ncbi:myosin heavy chain, cardiac muscle isoform isoform X2 [Pseudomyrmex gracilis]|uniref:myosin heavy chain, cardiac muscle isoform isoform X2 n=1 Tax=Pseudomyrmex gracilis TaxID=219809 RepID=UPI0009953290|nr:myosin heavy chain, cardiac muscle isoform isoform X2 [Pseudomyrmex gracilis]
MEYINRLLHRASSSPRTSSSPTPTSGGDNSTSKAAAEHEVKVCFTREFADVSPVAENLCPAPESLSSASSFHSLTSTLSTKSSSGICPDSAPEIADYVADTSYVNSSIPGVEDLILACAEINLGNESHELSQDQTFESATDETPFQESDCSFSDDNPGDDTQVIDEIDSPLHESFLSLTENSSSRPENHADLTIIECNASQEKQTVENDHSAKTLFVNDSESCENTVDVSISSLTKCVDNPLLFKLPSAPPIEDTNKPREDSAHDSSEPPRDTLLTSSSDNTNNELCILSQQVEDNPVAPAEKSETHTEDNSVLKEKNSDVIEEQNLSQPNIHIENNPVVQTEKTEVIEEQNLFQLETRIENNPVVPEKKSEVIEEQHSPQLETHIENNPVVPEKKNKVIEEQHSPQLETHIENNPVVPEKKNKVIEEQDLLQLETHTENNSLVSAEKSELLEEQHSSQSDTYITSHDSSQSLSKTLIVEQETVQITCKEDLEISNSVVSNKAQNFLPEEKPAICNETSVIEDRCEPSETIIVKEKENSAEGAALLSVIGETRNKSNEDLDRTLTLQEVDLNLVPEEYEDFKPQRQSTTLPLTEQTNFEDFVSTIEKVTNDLLNSAENSEDFAEDTEEQFVSATTELFKDPSTFDFLLARSTSNNIPAHRLRTESLYVKFDPLVSNTNMLPQGNVQPINEEQNGKTESPSPDVGTPKRNPAIAAIDRLLFYSPLSTTPVQKREEAQEKNEQPVEEPKSNTQLIADIDMSKELELVRTTVLQLEEQLEKQKKEHEAELERQKTVFQEKISKLQTQVAQEVKSRTQMAVVVEEYEKSISRLLTEREKDRTTFEQEKAKLQEELQAANLHLTNTEAAFNDVHQKYERLKGVVSVYKSNESVLKESVQENVETIKTLETRYEQLKQHAMTQLEKANLELDAKEKQHEAETVKLHAIIRKAELKSNSLAELVEQKTKENKELAKILDEVIARVGHGNSE